MKTGTMLHIEAAAALDRKGKLFLDVAKVGKEFSLNGDLHQQEKSTLERLRNEGVPEKNLGKGFRHTTGREAQFPPQLEHLLVIAPGDSHGLADFRDRIQGAERFGDLGVSYKSISWASASAPEDLKTTLAAEDVNNYDLVLVVRGGGHWSDLYIFNHPDVALSIHACTTPVATAIGHVLDVSLADRAAHLSFATPTAAGEAIKRELGRRHYKAEAAAAAPNAVPATGKAGADSYFVPKEVSLRHAREVDEARNKARLFEDLLRQCTAAHVGDLMALAIRRVRLLSFATFPAILVALGLVLWAQPAVLQAFGVGSSVPLQVSYSLGAIGLAVLTLRLRYRSHNAMETPARKPMRNPPANLNEWRSMARQVCTVRGLRQLVFHRPC